MMSGICTRKASGVGLRVCLYSAKSSCLRVGPFGSKNMPSPSTGHSSRTLSIMLKNPSTAFVGVPSAAESSGGRA